MKRLFNTLSQAVFVLILYAFAAVILAAALVPALMFYIFIIGNVDPVVLQLYALLGFTGGYFIFGLSLMFLVGFLCSLFSIQLVEGEYKIGELQTMKWYFVNALFLLVRTVFMDFMLLTPFCILFYKLMGAKVGRNVQINSKNVADHSLLEIGDNSVIGGNATVIGHLFESKGLRLSRVKIGKNVIVGLNSVIMPGVVIGDGSVVAAGAIVPKNTIIEPNTIYFSPERQKIKERGQNNE
jgi:hypothetical protein